MILVLLSPRNAGLPLGEWLREETGQLLAVTSRGVGPMPGFLDVVTVPDYFDDASVLEAARRMSERHSVTRILSLAEVDVVRAAFLREELGIPGQRPWSATAYRDKVVMKELAAAGGLCVPAFAPVASGADITAFMAAHPGPVVVKPRDGSGSTSVRILRAPREVSLIASTVSSGGYEVEEFISGRFCHVDALHVDGDPVACVPSIYTEGGCLAHWVDAGNGSHMLEPGTSLHDRLIEETWRLVAALPAAPSLFVHAEFFVTSADDIVVCEIAGRVGGTPIPAMLEVVLGLDPRHLWARIECGLPVDLDAVRRHARTAPLAANFGLPPRNGRITRVPSAAPDGAEAFAVLAEPGDDWSGDRYSQRKSGDFVATWLVRASTTPELIALLARTEADAVAAFGWDIAERARPATTESALARHLVETAL